MIKDICKIFLMWTTMIGFTTLVVLSILHP